MDKAEREVRPVEPLTMFELVFPSDLNTHGTMFGGKVVALMDKAAGLCAGRWCQRTPVTAGVDAIIFTTPIRQGQMVEAKAEVVFVGRTSCIAKVVVHATDLHTGDRFFCCQGHFTMVGIDTHGRPVPLPLIPVETEDQRHEWETAEKIKLAMLERRERSRRVPPV